MKLYKSKEKIWWNKGNEVKPTKNDFLKIEWEELPNFNINWVDEMTISLICGLKDTFDLIKVENEDSEEEYDKVRYYYLIGINNKTKVNKTCVFELDLWTTYILEDQNKLFDFPTYSAAIGVGNTNVGALDDKLWTPLVKFSAASIPKKDYIVKPLEWLNDDNIEIWEEYKVGNTGFVPAAWNKHGSGQFIAPKYASEIYNKDSQLSGCLYYVFKLAGGHYFVVPLLSDGGNKSPETLTNTDDIFLPFLKDKMSIPNVTIDDKSFVLCSNTVRGIRWLVNNYSKYDVPNPNEIITEGAWLQIGELVGLFYGPHNNRISSKITFCKVKKNNNYFNNSQTIPVASPKDVNNKTNSKVYYTSAGLVGSLYFTFAGYVLDNNGLDVLGFKGYRIGYIKNDYLEVVKKNLFIAGSDQTNILSLKGKLHFTNMLVFSAEGQIVELNTEIPFYIDSYTTKMNNQMNTFNTGYFWNQLNTAKNGVLGFVGAADSAYTPEYSSSSTISRDTERYIQGKQSGWISDKTRNKTVRTHFYEDDKIVNLASSSTRDFTRAASFNIGASLLGGAESTLNTGLQLAQNYAMRKAQLDDLRATLSTVNTSTNARCLQMISVLANKLNNQIEDYYVFDLAVGYDAEVIDEWYKLYGYEVNFYKINGSIKNVPDNTFVKTPDILKLKYLSNNILSPTIREALWLLLVNGVLVVNKDLATNGGY